jgi:predicted nucleic acid-binding protein
MTTFVVDASVVVKWVVEEPGTTDALALLRHARLIAPELLIAECANILWKKVERGELLKEEASLAARLLHGVQIEILPMRTLLEPATQLAIKLQHPAYDCFYLALAIENDCPFVTADAAFLRKLRMARQPALRSKGLTIKEATEG